MTGGRALSRIALGLGTLGAAVLGASGVALGTAAGRAVLVRTALGVANRAIHGTVMVGGTGGSVRSGLEARDVLVADAGGAILARIPRLSVRYRLRDLLSGRIVLGQLRLSRPDVTLVQGRNGRFNYEDLLGLGGPGGGGPSPLIAFRDVEVDSATVRIETPLDSTDTSVVEREAGKSGMLRVRRVEDLSARLSYLRITSPLPREHGIRADVSDLQARVSDPSLVLRGVRGRVDLDGDSLKLDLPRAGLAHSQATVRGVLSWPGGPLRFDLAVETRNGSVDDIRGLVPVLPRGLEATGSFTVRSRSANVVEFQSDHIAVIGVGGGGSLSGRLGMLIGPGGSWEARETDLALDGFNLDYVRPILDTLPVAGRLSGTLKANGPREQLALDLNWTFRDSLVPGWPDVGDGESVTGKLL